MECMRRLMKVALVLHVFAWQVACDVDEEQAPVVTQITPVRFEAFGRAVSSGQPLPNATVTVTRSLLGAGEVSSPEEVFMGEPVAEDGRFSVVIEDMDVEVYRYELSVKSPDPLLYEDALTILLYARRDLSLNLGDVNLPRLRRWPLGNITGVVKEGNRHARPIPNVRVLILAEEEGDRAPSVGGDADETALNERVLGEALTGADGVYSFEQLPLRPFRVHFDTTDQTFEGEEQAFISWSFFADLRPRAGEALIDLGATYLLPKVTGDQVRIMLSWPHSEGQPIDYDLRLSLPEEGCDVNHLTDQLSKLASPQISISPQSGFMSGTCYWPSGSRVVDSTAPVIYTDHETRCNAQPEQVLDPTTLSAHPPPNDSSCVVATLDNDSQDGSTPEVITIQQEWPFSRADIDPLSWYYEYPTSEGASSLRFPIGVMEVSVTAKGAPLSQGLNLSLFQGNHYLGSFDYPLSVEEERAEADDDQQTNVNQSWLATRIEYGFQTFNAVSPYRLDQGNEVRNEDATPLYFRVVPTELIVPSNEYIYPIRAKGTEDVHEIKGVFADDEFVFVVGESKDTSLATGWYLLRGERTFLSLSVPYIDLDKLDGFFVSNGLFFTLSDDSLILQTQGMAGSSTSTCDARINQIIDLGDVGGELLYRTFLVNTDNGIRLIRPTEQRCEPFFPVTCQEVVSCFDDCNGEASCEWRCSVYDQGRVGRAVSACGRCEQAVLSYCDELTSDPGERATCVATNPCEPEGSMSCEALTQACSSQTSSPLPSQEVSAIQLASGLYSDYIVVAMPHQEPHRIALPRDDFERTFTDGWEAIQGADGEGLQSFGNVLVTKIEDVDQRLYLMTNLGLFQAQFGEAPQLIELCDQGYCVNSLGVIEIINHKGELLASDDQGLIWNVSRGALIYQQSELIIERMISRGDQLFGVSGDRVIQLGEL